MTFLKVVFAIVITVLPVRTHTVTDPIVTPPPQTLEAESEDPPSTPTATPCVADCVQSPMQNNAPKTAQNGQEGASTPPQVVQTTQTNYDPIFERYFGESWKTARAVCTAESGLNPSSISPTHDYGLCQINQVHRKRVGGDLQKLLDPETNIRVASDIWREQGFSPWSVFKSGKYRRFL